MPTKASSSLEPRRLIFDRSMKNPLVSIDKWTCHCPMEGGVAKKSRRGNVKGSGICPRLHILSFKSYSKKPCHIKKVPSPFKRSKNRIDFFIYSKKVNFWPRKASFKAFASLRLQSEAFRGQKNTFFEFETVDYCF